eukprot:scaffold42093_cov17-Tisochrysis_lutea.AAC.1
MHGNLVTSVSSSLLEGALLPPVALWDADINRTVSKAATDERLTPRSWSSCCISEAWFDVASSASEAVMKKSAVIFPYARGLPACLIPFSQMTLKTSKKRSHQGAETIATLPSSLKSAWFLFVSVALQGTDIASNVSQAVKEKAADAKEAVKRVPAAVP